MRTDNCAERSRQNSLITAGNLLKTQMLLQRPGCAIANDLVRTRTHNEADPPHDPHKQKKPNTPSTHLQNHLKTGNNTRICNKAKTSGIQQFGNAHLESIRIHCAFGQEGRWAPTAVFCPLDDAHHG
mmetsp:Transcript_13655/g.31042  ORF Transcript_13655/g.31042 Transcript_13655/m.31042 type:complete len:127 (-) Transcript_13655:41-421(-)